MTRFKQCLSNEFCQRVMLPVCIWHEDPSCVFADIPIYWRPNSFIAALAALLQTFYSVTSSCSISDLELKWLVGKSHRWEPHSSKDKVFGKLQARTASKGLKKKKGGHPYWCEKDQKPSNSFIKYEEQTRMQLNCFDWDVWADKTHFYWFTSLWQREVCEEGMGNTCENLKYFKRRKSGQEDRFGLDDIVLWLWLGPFVIWRCQLDKLVCHISSWVMSVCRLFFDVLGYDMKQRMLTRG